MPVLRPQFLCGGRCRNGFPTRRAPISGGTGRPNRHCVHVANSADLNEVVTDIKSYPYNSGDDKLQKATLENVFGSITPPVMNSEPEESNEEVPWNLGWQMSERNLVWNDSLKVQLIKRIAIDELGISGEEMDWRLEQLAALLPGLPPRLLIASPSLVARMAAHTSDIGTRLLHLKNLFPKADLSTMVSRRLTLLLDDDLAGLQAAETRLRELLPDFNVDTFVTMYPLVLDISNFEVALQDVRRIMPGRDPVELLRTNPDLVLSMVKGKNLLPYDAFPNPWS